MRFEQTRLCGAWLIEPELARDHRGFFARTFCAQEYAERGLTARFVQNSTSYSAARGTLRGMHFQRHPHGEVKVVSCLKGAIWDVIIDLRPESPTYCRWQGFELSAANRRQLYVSEGFAHGFQTLCDDTEVGYLISAFYAPHAADGVRYDDPAFAINWPLPIMVISEKDGAWPDFNNLSRMGALSSNWKGIFVETSNARIALRPVQIVRRSSRRRGVDRAVGRREGPQWDSPGEAVACMTTTRGSQVRRLSPPRHINDGSAP